MPELPEVETIRCGLLSLVGQELTGITCHRPNLRHPLPIKALHRLVNTKLLTLDRRGKYLLWHFGEGLSMIMHLGMSGHIMFHATPPKASYHKHDHVVMTWADGSQIVFNDPRRFGMIDVMETSHLDQCNHLKNLGSEPLDQSFDVSYLSNRLQHRKAPIKNCLMDQYLVAGLGNIYCCESLFQARIHPQQPANSLTSDQIQNLIIAIKNVLQQAIKAGGSSLRNYRNANGELGYFQHHWSVYDREGETCADCGHPIQQVTMAGRSTYFCPNHQRINL